MCRARKETAIRIAGEELRLLDDGDRRRGGTRQGTHMEHEHVALDLQNDRFAGNPTQ